MTKIRNLEMGQTIANHPHIRVSKSFFGLSESIVYEPTGSKVSLILADYDPSEGTRLQHLLALSPEKMAREVAERGVPKSTAVGNYRLEGALSADRRYLALQLFQFADFRYRPVCEPLCYEGELAEVVAKLLQ